MFLKRLLTGKIHRATVTNSNLDYMGSITIDGTLMQAAGIHALEEVEIWDVTNGVRLSTYCLPGEDDSGIIQINGAAAHLIHNGDKIIIASFGMFDSAPVGRHIVPVVIPDENNKILKRIEYRADLITGRFDIVDL